MRISNFAVAGGYSEFSSVTGCGRIRRVGTDEAIAASTVASAVLAKLEQILSAHTLRCRLKAPC